MGRKMIEVCELEGMRIGGHLKRSVYIGLILVYIWGLSVYMEGYVGGIFGLCRFTSWVELIRRVVRPAMRRFFCGPVEKYFIKKVANSSYLCIFAENL